MQVLFLYHLIYYYCLQFLLEIRYNPLSDPFFKAELKFFETDERAAAEAWLQA